MKKLITLFAFTFLTCHAGFAQNFGSLKLKNNIQQNQSTPVSLSDQKFALKELQNSFNAIDNSRTDAEKQADSLVIANAHIANLMSVGLKSNNTAFTSMQQFKTVLNNNQKLQLKNIKARRDNLAHSQTDLLAATNDSIADIKLDYTLNFLTTSQKPKDFLLTDIGNYNVDTLNSFFYDETKYDFLSNVAIQSIQNTDNIINGEITNFLFGPLKLALGGSFKTKGDTSKDNAIKTSLQKIISNGGTINLDFSVPFYFSRSTADRTHFGIFLQDKNGFNPDINDTTGKTSFNSDKFIFTNQLGIIPHVDITSNNFDARLSFNFPTYYSFASNNAYDLYNTRDFFFSNLQVGLIFKNLVSLYISGPIWSTSRRVWNIPYTLSIGLSPSELVKN